MRFDSAAGVKQKDGKAFAFRVEIGIARNVQMPVLGGFLRGVAKQQGFRRGAFAERDNFVLVRLRVEFEGLHERDHGTTDHGTTYRKGEISLRVHKKGNLKFERGRRAEDCPPYLV